MISGAQRLLCVFHSYMSHRKCLLLLPFKPPLVCVQDPPRHKWLILAVSISTVAMILTSLGDSLQDISAARITSRQTK